MIFVPGDKLNFNISIQINFSCFCDLPDDLSAKLEKVCYSYLEKLKDRGSHQIFKEADL